MTISYSLKVSRASLCSFSRLLFMWRGSIYKLIWKELIVFLLLYYGLSIIYRFALTTDELREPFELLCIFFKDRILGIIPLSFILGFYVSLVVSRWWSMYDTIPWTDETCQMIATHVQGADEEMRKARRTLVRWLNLTITIVFTSVSMPVLKRFPTLGHIVRAGLMTKKERLEYENLPTTFVKFWLPVGWACNLVRKLREDGKIKDDVAVNLLLQKFQGIRGSCGGMMGYDWISVPLVYTQVVTIVTYGYFLAKLFADQFLDPARSREDGGSAIDFYFPILTVLEFFFYFGWLKVAEAIINPYGDDDDDFELSEIIDRNFQVGLLIVDDLYGHYPDIEKDMYWDEKEFTLPYTKSTLKKGSRTWLGSTVDVLLFAKDFVIAVPTSIAHIAKHHKQPTKGEATEMQPIGAEGEAKIDIPGTVEKPQRMTEEDAKQRKISPKKGKKQTEVVVTPSGAKVRVAGDLPPDVSEDVDNPETNPEVQAAEA
ncbi:bestrophin-2a-like [Glandiceps talaboti]